jgi:hypothetical protein
MNYPDGRQVQIGDRVWWDGGISVGYIQHILEDREAYESWGLNEPTVMIATARDFNIEAPFMGMPYRLFEDDGIGIPDAKESEVVNSVFTAVTAYLNLQATERIGLWLEYDGTKITKWFAIHYADVKEKDAVYVISPELSVRPIAPDEKVNHFYLRGILGGGLIDPQG